MSIDSIRRTTSNNKKRYSIEYLCNVAFDYSSRAWDNESSDTTSAISAGGNNHILIAQGHFPNFIEFPLLIRHVVDYLVCFVEIFHFIKVFIYFHFGQPLFLYDTIITFFSFKVKR